MNFEIDGDEKMDFNIHLDPDNDQLSWYRRHLVRVILVVAAAIALILLLVGCAKSPSSFQDVEDGDWYTIVDPDTGVSLRCNMLTSNLGGRRGVLDRVCYVLEEDMTND